MKKIISSILIIVLLISTLSSCLLPRKPIKYLSDAIDESINQAISNDWQKFLDALSECGSIEIGVSSLSDISGGLLDDGDNLAVKYYFGDGEVFEIDGRLFGKEIGFISTADENKIVLKTSLLENSYGVNLKDAKKNLRLSFIYDKIKEQFGDSADEKAKNIDDFIDSLRNSVKLSKDIKKYVDKYSNVLKNIVNDVCSATRDSEKGGSAVSFSFNRDRIVEIAKKLYAEFKTDKGLRKFIENNLSYIFENCDIENVDNLYNITDSKIEESIDKMIGDNANINISVDVHISSKKVIKEINIQVYDGNELLGSLDIILSKEKITLVYNDEEGTKSVVYDVTENTKDKYSAVLSITNADDVTSTTTKIAEINYNKTTETYVATIFADGEKVEVSGEYSLNGNTLQATVGSVTLNGDNIFSGRIKLTVVAKDRMPDSIKNYKDILTLTEDEFNTIVSELTEKVSDYIPSSILFPIDDVWDHDTYSDWDF